MKHFSMEPEKFKNLLKNKCVFLFLDFDGTVAPIAPTPQKALIPRDTKKVLRLLTKNHHCKLALISGRALNDLKKKVGFKNIFYAGNHGIEINGPNLNYKHQMPHGYKRILKHISSDLKETLADIKGIVIEDKNYSMSLHYRLVDPKLFPIVRSRFNYVTRDYLLQNKITVTTGKLILEVRPPLNWNKGASVLWLLENIHTPKGTTGFLPFYIGDDLTDEDAFNALKSNGVTIFVGAKKKSLAKFYLKDTSEVVDFLKQLAEITKNNSSN